MADAIDATRIPHGSVVTVGTFDGVHRGHRLVLERTATAARERGLSSVVVTFDPHPLDVVNPSAAPPLLTLWEEKLEVFAQTPIDYVAVVPFTAELSALTPEQFVQRVLVDRYAMRELLIGPDHGFGRGRAGDAESLRLIGLRLGFPVQVVAPAGVVELPVVDLSGLAHEARPVVLRELVGAAHRRPFDLVAGRDFSPADTEQAPPVVILNDVVASALWNMWQFPDLSGTAALSIMLMGALLALVLVWSSGAIMAQLGITERVGLTL